MDEHSGDYERLIRPIEDRMIRSVWRIVRNPDDFDDAFQEALATVWRRLAKVRRHPNPHALVLRMCANAAYDVLRKKSRLRRREALGTIPDQFPDRAPSASDRMAREGDQKEIFEAIGQLPRKQAEAVMMRFVQELSYSEISQALGCSEPAARRSIARARQRLGVMLAHLAPFSHPEATK